MKKLPRIILFLFIAVVISLYGCGSGTSTSNNNNDDMTTTRPWIDTHAHPKGVQTDCTSESCISAAVATMDQDRVKKTVFMHPPAPSTGRSETTEALILEAVSYDTDHLYYGAGGNVLNALIQLTPDDGDVPAGLQQNFENVAQELVDAGNAVSFGEMAALHLSYYEGHSFEETAPNTALFYKLADIAAESGYPIDLHMDAVVDTMATPSYFTERSSANPAELQANIANFAILLAYNRNAKIVWAHVGRDTTGDLSASLVRNLLDNHPNLYIQIHPIYGPLGTINSIVDKDGIIRTEWMEILESYSSRIVMGSDNFYEGTEDDGDQLSYVQSFLQQLPEDLAYQIGCENPVTIYNLSSGC